MDVVPENFFERLPVGDVVSSLETAARDRVCQATGIAPDKLPDPLLSDEDITKAVEPLRQAVTAEVANMQRSFQTKLEEERREHQEELNKRRRLDSDNNDDESEHEEVVGTYDCDNGHVCDDPRHCEDGRLVPYELEDLNDDELLEYARTYLHKELANAQKRLDRCFILVSKADNRATSFTAHTQLSPDRYVLTPAKKRVCDYDNDTTEFMKIMKFQLGDWCDTSLYLASFMGTALPKYEHEGTYLVAAAWTPQRVRDMLQLIDKGVGFKEYEEYGRFHHPETIHRDLGRLYAVALLLRNHNFSDDDYEHMRNELKKHADESW